MKTEKEGIMETENTPANKERFVALYWGQRILLDANNGGEPTLYPVDRSNMYRLDESILELTPLSQISDEDAIAVAKILDFHDGDGLLIYRYNTRISMYDRYNGNPDKQDALHFYYSVLEVFSLDENGKVFQYDFDRLIRVYNYLISRGYYVGDGTEIEYGWVKLKGGDNGNT